MWLKPKQPQNSTNLKSQNPLQSIVHIAKQVIKQSKAAATSEQVERWTESDIQTPVE